ncbi:MAG: flagellar type III secretion system pore protein FliP [Proteobacteria bacterium]|nr:flagellar type III secretion system pore protein FliP [Pseudomonadota bacterium]
MRLDLPPARRVLFFFHGLAVLLPFAFPLAASADPLALPGFTSKPLPDGGQSFSLPLETLLILTSLSFLPTALLMMTSFTRIVIVLSFLRQALGTQSAPPNQALVGLAFFLTLFVMGPIFEQVYQNAIQPYSESKISFMDAVEKGGGPIKDFMLRQTRQADLALFVKLSKSPPLQGPENVSFRILVPAYLTSELKTAFQIGFSIYIPFLIIDMVVATLLMSMGMMMMSPSIVALPFKLMLFVLVDGWQLVIGSLAQSFY